MNVQIIFPNYPFPSLSLCFVSHHPNLSLNFCKGLPSDPLDCPPPHASYIPRPGLSFRNTDVTHTAVVPCFLLPGYSLFQQSSWTPIKFQVQCYGMKMRKMNKLYP